LTAVAVYVGLTTFLAVVAVAATAAFWQRTGHLKENYQGKRIPQSMGIAFLPVYGVASIWAARKGLMAGELLIAAFLLVYGLCILGVLDDLWGDNSSKGFAGHFRQLLCGRITTGFLKAVLGFGICLLVVCFLSGFKLLRFWEAALIALSANLLNLLDLRPGRALKVFFLLALLWIWLFPQEEQILLLFPFLVTALVFLPSDLRGEAMLGDAGANLLGAMVGLAVVLYGGFWWQFLYFLLLLFIHFLAERISLTDYIARHPLLAYFDRLGRREYHTGREQG